MATKAAMRPGYLWRAPAFAVLCLFVGVWFLKDGYYEYPRQREIFRAYSALAEKNELAKWRALAHERGWPEDSDVQQGKDHSDGGIMLQKAIGWALIPVSLLFAIGYVRMRARWIACDGQAITTSWGLTVPLEAVSSLNKDRWDTKGIAVAHFNHNGQPGRVVLDDWKHETKPTRAIVDQIGARLGEHGGAEEPSGDGGAEGRADGDAAHAVDDAAQAQGDPDTGSSPSSPRT